MARNSANDDLRSPLQEDLQETEEHVTRNHRDQFLKILRVFLSPWLVSTVMALACSGCQSHDAQLRAANESVESIRATTSTVVKAWLDGTISDRFASVAVERAYQLSEQTRTGLAASPQSIADSHASAIADQCERLSRLLARLEASIDGHDRGAARDALIDISS
jgi:hypothetical protein